MCSIKGVTISTAHRKLIEMMSQSNVSYVNELSRHKKMTIFNFYKSQLHCSNAEKNLKNRIEMTLNLMIK